MAKYRPLLVAFIIASVLAVAYYYGGNFSKGGYAAQPQAPASVDAVAQAPSSEKPQIAEASPIDPEAGKDAHFTGPAPSDSLMPADQNAAYSGSEFSVSLSVRCDAILGNMNLLDDDKKELVPADGTIFPASTVEAYVGESVFNVLQREMKRARIHLEFMNTPIYNSAYIEGINNIYEYDAGELSGWMYKVNGRFPNYGCSRHLLQPGDAIEWIYTCDLGRDVGADEFSGGQKDE
ncbi:MAG: DUF4430 domain-containing protein [Clostridiales bacterium]|nr:DUF4430 domain-containing protein [Clostridiales bacterium]